MAPKKLSKLADELEGLDDEPTGEIHINPPKGSRTEVGPDATGKMRAVIISDDDITPTDPPRKIQSEPPKSGIPGYIAAGAGGVAKVLAAVNNAYTLLALALLVAAFIAWLRLRP